MPEFIVILISLISGIIIGWVLKGLGQSKLVNSNEVDITRLTEEKARAEAKLEQMDEIKSGMILF